MDSIVTAALGPVLMMNILAFVLMGADKRRAKLRRWRIPEKTVFLPVLLGGGVGGTLGMFFFHHKTRHMLFRIGFPLITVAETTLAFWLRQTSSL